MKRSTRRIRILFFIVLSFLGSWFITAAIIDDTEPTSLIEKYTQEQRPIDRGRDSLRAALYGLYAPVGVDFYAYGQRRMINRGMDTSGRIALTDEVSIVDLDCITNYKRQVINAEVCLGTDILTAYIAQNSVLLDRYAEVLNISHAHALSSQANDKARSVPLSGLVHLNKLTLVQYAVMVQRGEVEQAISLYNKNIGFVRQLLQAETGFVGFAIPLNMMQSIISFQPYFVNLIKRQGYNRPIDLNALAFSWGQYKEISKRVLGGEVKRMFEHSLAASTGIDGQYHGWFGLRLADSVFDFHNVFLKRLDRINQDFVGAVDRAENPQDLIKGIRNVVYSNYTSGAFAVRSFRELLNPTGHIKTNILVNEMIKGFGLFEAFYYQNQLAELADIYAHPEFDDAKPYFLTETQLPVVADRTRLCVSNIDGVYMARKCLYTRQ